jgi:hypothetical protein
MVEGDSMKKLLLLLTALAGGAVLLSSTGCDNMDKGTVQLSVTYQNICPIYANLDGSNAVTFTSPQTYQFPLVNPGSHTMNLGTTGQCYNSTNCTLSKSSVTFQVNGGNLYVIKVAEGANCSDLQVTGP